MAKIISRRKCGLFSRVFSFVFGMLILVSCGKSIESVEPEQSTGPEQSIKKPVKDFTQVNLVGSNAEYDPLRIDPLLKNAWGIAFSSGGTAWISATGTGVSTVYNKDGGQQLAAVSIPSPIAATGGLPTGQVLNPTTDFKLLNGNAARFIFVGVDGVISGWNGGTAAVRMVNRSATAAYTGAAFASSGGSNYLYAADFRGGSIEVFDKNWALVNMSFTDPDLPAGYSPFNIELVSNQLFVMYAKVGPDGRDVPHPGYGYVSIFNTDGSFIKRFTSQGQLNAPWGIAKAHAGFYGDGGGTDSTILVGNFGDGRINAFTLDGTFIGQLRAHGNPIVIDGLWAIKFAPATATTVDHNRLYFAAGPDHEEEGLFGYVIKE
jgi:uncharacterized protein (TIGR03118 family)